MRREEDKIMAVITISRQFGSGGDEIAHCVASALGYDLINKEQIVEAARLARGGVEAVVPTNAFHFLTAWYMQQDCSFLPAELCYYELPDKLFENHSVYDYNDMDYHGREHRRTFFQKTIELLWKRGNIVILGRGANYILKGCAPDVLCVRMIAPFTARVYRVARKEGLGYGEALDVVLENDRLRARYLHESYQCRWDDESLYDLILNMEKIGHAVAVDLIACALKALDTRLEAPSLLAYRREPMNWGMNSLADISNQ
jgi:cytidylate kinase